MHKCKLNLRVVWSTDAYGRMAEGSDLDAHPLNLVPRLGPRRRPRTVFESPARGERGVGSG